MSEAKRKTKRLVGNKRLSRLSVWAIIASEPFRQGVKEYRTGKWSELPEKWRQYSAQELYERGRLVAALMGEQPITVAIYEQARVQGAIPPVAQAPVKKPKDPTA